MSSPMPVLGLADCLPSHSAMSPHSPTNTSASLTSTKHYPEILLLQAFKLTQTSLHRQISNQHYTYYKTIIWTLHTTIRRTTETKIKYKYNGYATISHGWTVNVHWCTLSIRSRSALLHKLYYIYIFVSIECQCCTLYSMDYSPLALFLSGLCHIKYSTLHSNIIMHRSKCDRLNGWKTSALALTT